jgi:EmrB/QacA subfamily drug resistance transporter
MVSTGLVALDSTIIATAVPTVVRDLGGFSQYPWLFSIYLLAQAVTVPLYGKSADVVGRRPVMFLGIGVFLAASVMCGISWSMPALIAFRALQGIGAGAIQPMSMTIVGDLYSVQERARVQGYVASVWALAAVGGPALGGIFSQYLTWRWIFFVNLPLGTLAYWLLFRHFHEERIRHPRRIDVRGGVLLIGGCSVLILTLIEGGVAWPWFSLPTLTLTVTGSVMLSVFVLAERRTPEPILPLWVFRRRTTAGASAAAFGIGAVLIGLSSYIPTYAQVVLGAGALVAGFAVAMMNIGWPLAATIAGRIYLRIGFRDTALIGAGVLVAGTVLYNTMSPHGPILVLAAAGLVVGLGMGLTANPTLVAAQMVVDWDRRGVVTGAYMFARSLGSAVGAAVFGAISSAAFAASLRRSGRFRSLTPASLFQQQPSAAYGSETLESVRTALYQASHAVFLALFVLALVVVASVLVIPRRTEVLSFTALTVEQTELDRPVSRVSPTPRDERSET